MYRAKIGNRRDGLHTHLSWHPTIEGAEVEALEAKRLHESQVIHPATPEAHFIYRIEISRLR